MTILSYFSHPLCYLMLKMLLLVCLLMWLNKLSLNAKSKALLWQIGLIFLLILPGFQLLLPAIQLPILPVLETSQSSLSDQVASVYLLTPNSYGFDAVLVLLFMVSLLLLISLMIQLSKLSQLTQQAQPLTNTTTRSIIDNCLKEFQFSRQPKILISEQIVAPCTWGVVKPVILLPANISTNKTLKLVLLHEMAHIKRKDWLWLMVSKLMVAVFWFNPLVWYVQRQMINSSESACDELVLQQQIQPSEYAETLLGFHQTCQGWTAITANMAQQSLLYKRLQQILTPRRITMKKRTPSWLIVSLCFTFVLLSVTQLTTAQIESQPLPDRDSIADSAPAIAPAPESPPVVPMPDVEPKAELPTAPPLPNAPAKPMTPAVPATKSTLEKNEADSVDFPVARLSLLERTADKRIVHRAQLLAERAEVQRAQKQIRLEERQLKMEKLQLERQMERLNDHRKLLVAGNQDREKLRAQEGLIRAESKKMAEQARLVRLKAREQFQNIETGQ